jgi:hypothetical protein
VSLRARVESSLLQEKEKIDMIVYRLYKHDQTEEPNLIGILPERRKDRKRITEESVLNWGKEVTGESSDIYSLYFVQMEM